MKQLELTILGRPHSKKNSKRIYGAGSKKIVIPSAAYEAFHDYALLQINRYRGSFTGPVHIQYIFYVKGKMRQDISNAIQSIDDILQDAGVIADDYDICEGKFCRVMGCKDWSTDLIITDLTKP